MMIASKKFICAYSFVFISLLLSINQVVVGLQCSFPISIQGSTESFFKLGGRRNEESYDYYDDSYYTEREESDNRNDKGEDKGEDGYWNQEGNSRKQQQKQNNRGGMYKVYFDGDVDPKETQLDWEVCNDGESEALVLLPPAAVERPTAILHFVGGTFFGSAPRVWYSTFLEDLVRNTQCAIVVTPIPVTLFKSPLQHIELSQKLRRAFEYAWDVVLEDEYGDLNDIPLCGVGHSLGSRLLVVSSTIDLNEPRNRNIPPYKSFVLISFTNFGASAGIPGVSTLLRQSRRHEQKAQVSGERKRRKKAQQARRDWWVDDNYDDDATDEDWAELVDDLQDVLQEQADRVKTALTPKSEDLEFFPSPDMLWKALEVDNRYRIPQTLVVQFDQDDVDQSSKLATILQATNSTDIKFARLRGTHLSPVTVSDGENNIGNKNWFDLPSKASMTVWKAIRGKSKTKSQEVAMRDLRQTLARYVTDIVTK